MAKTITTFFVCSFLITVQINAQKKESKLTIDGFSYSDPSDYNQHKYFTLSYDIGSNLFAEIHEYYDTYTIIDVFRVPIIAKKYLSDKFYFFSGFEVEYHIRKDTSKVYPTLYKLINGVGYDMNNHFSLEAKQDYNLNTEGFMNSTGGPNLFLVKAKYKF